MKPRKALVLSLAMLALTACGPDYAAKVNGEGILLDEYKKSRDAKVKAHRAAGGGPIDEDAVGRAVLEELIAKTLLLRGAKDRGVSVTDDELRAEAEEVKARMNAGAFAKKLIDRRLTYNGFIGELREEMLILAFRKTLVGIDDVPFDDIKKRYAKGPRPVKTPETLLIRFIEIKEEEEARRIHGKLKHTPFDKAALELNKSGEAVISNKFTVPSPLLPLLVRQVLDTLEPGGVSRPVGVSGAWRIYKLYARKGAVEASFKEAKERMLIEILERRRTRALNEWVRARRGRAKVKIYEGKL